MVVIVGVWVFFFKQKTAYEMRISDWSSDVCSSDLGLADSLGGVGLGLAERGVDQGVECGVGHGLLDQSLGFDLEGVDVGEGQSERVAGGLNGGLGVAGVPDRERRLVVAQGRALGVRADDADRGDEDAERAGAVVAVRSEEHTSELPY